MIIPAFNSTGGYDYWNKLNGNGAPMPGHIPLATAVHTLLWILLPTSGLLALRSPLILAALPTLGWRFISHDDHYWGTDWHYSAVLMPIVVLALVDAADRSRGSRMPWLRSYASGAPAAVAGAALALTLTLPLASLSHGDAYKVDARTKAIEQLLDRIPDGASVEANVGPISRLVSRTTVYWVGDTPGVVPALHRHRQLGLGRRPGHLRQAAAPRGDVHPGRQRRGLRGPAPQLRTAAGPVRTDGHERPAPRTEGVGRSRVSQVPAYTAEADQQVQVAAGRHAEDPSEAW